MKILLKTINKSNRADLHNHTTASDGLLSPYQLIEYAVKKNLDAVAVTDHDTIDGIEEALNAGEKYGIEVIPGIEINTQLNSKEIHILGYYIDWKSSHLQNILKKMKDARISRAKRMIENLNKLYGLDVSYDEVVYQSKNGIIGRMHLARILVSKGIVNDISEAFNKYLGTESPAYVKRYHLTPEEGISLINKVGGVAILAHPGLLPDPFLLNIILDIGIDGIEVFHSKHTEEQTEYYEKIAIENKLLITGGSDCHGELINGFPTVGDVTVDMEKVISLRNRANRKK